MPYQAPFGPSTFAVCGGPDLRATADPVAIIEARFAALAGGIGAIATASGAEALHLAIATLLPPGTEILTTEDLAEPVRSLLLGLQPRSGVVTRTVRGGTPGDWEAALRTDVRLIVAPSLGHHERQVLDIPALAEWAHGHGLPLLVDGTDPGPALQKPLDLGADIVAYDTGAMTGGAGGVLVDGGRFDWFLGRPFPALTARSSATGRCPAADQPLTAFLTLARQGLRPGLGAQMSSLEAHRLLDALPTLALAASACASSAASLADHLDNHPAITAVHYPALDSHPDCGLASRLLPKGGGNVLSFTLAGGEAMNEVFLTSLRLLGQGSPSPHRTTLLRAVASGPEHPGLWCLAVGLEDPADLLEDLGRALNRVAKALETGP